MAAELPKRKGSDENSKSYESYKLKDSQDSKEDLGSSKYTGTPGLYTGTPGLYTGMPGLYTSTPGLYTGTPGRYQKAVFMVMRTSSHYEAYRWRI